MSAAIIFAGLMIYLGLCKVAEALEEPEEE
jgi:hypothetical protein